MRFRVFVEEGAQVMGRSLQAGEKVHVEQVQVDGIRIVTAGPKGLPRATLLYGGSRRYREGGIDVIPLEEGLRSLAALIE
ncbi:MAG: hypothetical protein ABR538_06835 [Candidatus Binatia bacterium]